MTREPHRDGLSHSIRVARALALLSSIALPACYEAHGRISDGLADAGPAHDAFLTRDADLNPCTACRCSMTRVDPDPTTCEGRGHWECCATLGPLPPPDLSA